MTDQHTFHIYAPTRADGFEAGFAEMCSFFRKQYKDLGDQFTGIAIFW